MLDKLLPFFIAGALGLAIGIERERHRPDTEAMGVRSFILLGILGALTAMIENALLQAAICFFAGAAIVVGYIRSSAKISHHQKLNVGLTTEIAGCSTFVLGYLAHIDSLLSAILGLLVLIVLLSHQSLHRFSKEQLQSNEIQAAVMLFVLVLGILPLIPADLTDPWGLFNMKQIVMIITFVAGVQFLNYIAVRIFGGEIGLSLAGFLAGFVSSTAAFLNLSMLAKKDKKYVYSVASASIFSAVAAFIFLLIIVANLSLKLFFSILPIVLPSVIIGASIGLFLAKYQTQKGTFPILKNPLSLKTAIRLGLFIVFMMAIFGLIHKFVNTTGIKLASFLGGLSEIHAVSISATSLYNTSRISVELAKESILYAALGSLFSKLFITWIVARGKCVLLITVAITCMLIAFLLPWLLF